MLCRLTAAAHRSQSKPTNQSFLVAIYFFDHPNTIIHNSNNKDEARHPFLDSHHRRRLCSCWQVRGDDFRSERI